MVSETYVTGPKEMKRLGGSNANVVVSPLSMSKILGAESINFEFSMLDINWNYVTFEEPQRDITEIIYRDIVIGNYENALDNMFEEIWRHSEILANRFDKAVENRVFIPQLLEELNEDGIIIDQEYTRLNALLLIFDGIINEVKEHNGRFEPEDAEYIIEYIKITEDIMTRYSIAIEPIKESRNIFINGNYVFFSESSEGISISPTSYNATTSNFVTFTDYLKAV